MTASASTHDLIDSRYAWFRLGISVTVSIVGGAGMWLIILVLPRVQSEFGLERGDVSFAYTATMLGFAIGNLLMGRLVDRRSLADVIIFSALLCSTGYFLATLTPWFWMFALVQGTLIGVGTSACFGPLMADVSHWFSKQRGIAIAFAASGNYLAGVLWPIALQPALVAGGWKASYLVMAVSSLVVMVPLAWLLRRPPPYRNQEQAPAQALTNDAGAPPKNARMPDHVLIALLALAGLSCCVAMSMPQVHIVAYCADLGYGVAVGAEMLALMLAGGVVSRLTFGLIADKMGGAATVLLGSTLQCLALFLYLPFDGLTSLYLVSLIFGLSQGGIVPSYAVMIREYMPAKVAGERVGLVVMMTILGMALGGWLSGVIFDATGSYQMAFINGIIWNLGNMAIVGFIWWQSSNATPRSQAYPTSLTK